MSGHFVDASGATSPREPEYWDPVIFRQAEIDAEVARLCDIPRPANGRRSSVFTHPRAPDDHPSLAPGIRVSLDVLLPGERTNPVRHTSTQVGFCVQGSGTVEFEDRSFDVVQYDAWNHPSWQPYAFGNNTADPFVRFTYSNAPVLERLNVHLVDDAAELVSSTDGAGESPPDVEPPAHEEGNTASPYGTFELRDGAMLMPYETLISPPALPSPALHWPWSDVKRHLDELEALGDRYVGRRLYLLYNPLTGRTNGTTPSFFATITIRPPGIVDRPHRHVSAAINYFFHGSGWSRVGGKRYEWSAGDLMLTAPGWMIHHHASGDDSHVYELTVQDQPMNIAMESLLWQEDLKLPPRVLGSERGFATNRASP